MCLFTNTRNLWPPQALAYALIEVYRLNGDVLREGVVEEFFWKLGYQNHPFWWSTILSKWWFHCWNAPQTVNVTCSQNDGLEDVHTLEIQLFAASMSNFETEPLNCSVRSPKSQLGMFQDIASFQRLTWYIGFDSSPYLFLAGYGQSGLQTQRPWAFTWKTAIVLTLQMLSFQILHGILLKDVIFLALWICGISCQQRCAWFGSFATWIRYTGHPLGRLAIDARVLCLPPMADVCV